MTKVKSINFLKEKEIYIKNICEKLASLKTAEEVSDFLNRLLTKNEIDRVARRLGVARRLMDKISYVKISTDLLVGSDTISRVSRWIKEGIYNVSRSRKTRPYSVEDGSREPLSSRWVRKRYPWHFVLSEILKSKK